MITDLNSVLFHQTRVAEEESGLFFDPVIGIVTDIKDDQKLCRIKVKIPALPITDNSWWCNWISIGGSKDRGWFSIPEVDDEVLIMFEHGDISRPLVLGALWNGKDKAIDNNKDDKNARRVFKSKAGHKVTFEDIEKFIQIEDAGGIGVVKIDGKNNKIEFEAKTGDVGIQCKEDMQILAGEIQITAKSACDLMGKSSGVNASATATVKIDGNMVALKGSTIDINPGGVPKAAKASGTVAEIPDPVQG